MKKYEINDNYSRRLHTVEVLLQYQEYKGKVIFKIGGNCAGLDILRCVDEDFIWDINDYEKVNCSIELLGKDDDGVAWVRYTLTDDEGNTLEGEDYCRDFSRLITGINIVDCIKE